MRGGLFSGYFLAEGITETPEWAALDDARVESFRGAVLSLFAAFPTASTPNEAQTEVDLIWKVLDLLGWTDHLRQQNLSAKGKDDVPDGLLFVDADAKARANAKNEEWRRYEDGAAIVESKRWQRKLDRKDALKEDIGVPSTQILRYLRRVDDITRGGVRWGMLANGRIWRLYFQGAISVSEDFLEVDLPVLLGAPGFDPSLFDGDPGHALRVFMLIFGRAAFLPDADGQTFLERCRGEAAHWERGVADSLSVLAFREVFPELVRAIAASDPKAPGPIGQDYLNEVRDAALVLLYRLLFILYAEDRGLLPVADTRYDDYGMRQAIRDDIAERIDKGDTFIAEIGPYYERLRDLFRIIDKGADSIGLPPYNGGLFDRSRSPILDRIELSDAVLAPLIDKLSRFDDKGRRVRINYRDLSVQQLGSIYEGLLENEVRFDDGAITVEIDKDARHATGSYYTPEAPVQFIIDRAVGPLLERRLGDFREKVQALAGERRPTKARLADLAALDPATRFLEIKVCDPAMGSGHFLVSLVDYLADRTLDAIAEAEAEVDWAAYSSPLIEALATIRDHIRRQADDNGWAIADEQLEDRQLIRRMILKRVIYGVDKNPMAVELAMVSLWLHTFTVGAPLSFLNHHLRCGDSICGEWVRPVEDRLVARGTMFLHGSVARAKSTAKTMAEIERLTDADVAQVAASSSAFDAIEEATEPLARFLDFMHALGRLDVGDKTTRHAIDALFDGHFGDPLRIVAGIDAPAAPEATGAPALIPGDKPEEYSLLPKSPGDARVHAALVDLLAKVRALADSEHLLHWQVAFPGVWEDWESIAPKGGFDAVIGNPPYVRQELMRRAKPFLRQAYATFHGMADLYVYFYEIGLKILKPGGRLSYIVTNKWMKAGYAEALRALFAERAWVVEVVDFGHAKQIFPDADVFPCIVVVQRPDQDPPPPETRVAVIDRERLRLDAMQQQVGEWGFSVPRKQLGRESWTLEPPEVLRLMEKIRDGGRRLRDVAGGEPLYGIKTGFNEAFLIDTPTRDRLVAADPALDTIIRPYLRGQDIARWAPTWAGLWMIFTRRGFDLRSHPVLEKYLGKFRERLEPKPKHWRPKNSDEKWKGRKEGNYKWYEIQDSVDYWESFLQPKIVYQDITWKPSFSFDDGGRFANNTVYFLPNASKWVLSVLNAPIGWWYSWRKAQHGKDEALRYFTAFVETYPIPDPLEDDRPKSEEHVNRLIEITNALHRVQAQTLDWLKVEFDIDKPGRRFDDLATLDTDAFLAAVRRARPGAPKLTPAAIAALREGHAETVAPARALKAEASRHEWAVNDLVNRAYGLTADEIALMWRTAPPRMPLSPEAMEGDSDEEDG